MDVRRAGGRGGRLGPGGGPELAQLAGELLAGGGPVGADVIAQLLYVALEVELVLLEPADVEFLAGGAALELTRNVLFVVADDPVCRQYWLFLFSSPWPSGVLNSRGPPGRARFLLSWMVPGLG